jgi:DMSO/TMAO reductase YedYZ heme-binding membrane subunit
MIALSSPTLWYASRAAGIVTLLLLTVVMAFGIMTATRVGGKPLPRFAVAELHRRLSLLAMAFLAIHVGTTVMDSYVNTGLLSVIIPGASHYKTVWVAFGTVALDLIVAIMITSLMRQRISHDAWRAIHWLSYLAWPVALIHTIFIGTDVKFGWMDLVVAGCVAVVVAAAAWRIWANPHPDGALTAVPHRTVPGSKRAASPSAPPRSCQSAPDKAKPVAQSPRRRPR